MGLDDLRTTVLRRLHAAAGDGRLDHAIAMSRIGRAEQAATADELEVLLAGLDSPAPDRAAGAVPVVVEAYPAAVQAAPTTADPGSSAESRIAIRAHMRKVVRQGPWQVPAFLLVDPGFSSVLLDFVAAVPDSSVIDIRIAESNGWTRLIVPEGWGVDSDDLTRSWGYLGNHVPPESRRPDQPRIVVRGNLGSGYCTIRNPKPRDRRRLAAYLAKQQRELGS